MHNNYIVPLKLFVAINDRYHSLFAGIFYHKKFSDGIFNLWIVHLNCIRSFAAELNPYIIIYE